MKQRKKSKFVEEKYLQRRDGLFIKGEILSVVKKLSKKYNKKEKIILEMIKKCKELGYNIRESKVLIEEFFEL